MRGLWWLVLLTGVLFVGWAIVLAGLYQLDEDIRTAGLAVLALPALALAIRDHLRARKPTR